MRDVWCLSFSVYDIVSMYSAHFFQFFFAVLLLVVCTDDVLYEAVTYYVGFVQLDMSYAFDVLQDSGCLDKARALMLRQVHLGHIAGDDGFGGGADTGEKHLYLQLRGVLGLVEDDEGIVQGTAAHIG